MREKSGGSKMSCCENKNLEILLICECYECGDIEEVKRERKVCPFDNQCNYELFHYQRERCVNCDYADYYCEA